MKTSNHRRSAFIVVTWLLSAAILAPVTELGDLLEAVLTAPRRGQIAAPLSTLPSLAAHTKERCPAPGDSDQKGIVLGRYVVGLSPAARLDLVLDPICRILDDPGYDLSEVWAAWRDLERGPPRDPSLRAS